MVVSIDIWTSMLYSQYNKEPPKHGWVILRSPVRSQTPLSSEALSILGLADTSPVNACVFVKAA